MVFTGCGYGRTKAIDSFCKYSEANIDMKVITRLGMLSVIYRNGMQVIK